MSLKSTIIRYLPVLFSIALLSCATRNKPCTDGGEAALGKQLRGNKQCQQAKDESGKFVNHGKYVEWYPSGKRAVEGDYKMGRKHGKWIEWDEAGRKTSEKMYEDGVEVPVRESGPRREDKADTPRR